MSNWIPALHAGMTQRGVVLKVTEALLTLFSNDEGCEVQCRTFPLAQFAILDPRSAILSLHLDRRCKNFAPLPSI
jgi:hypothetical protein